MKKILLCTMIVAIAVAAQAQHPEHPQPGRMHHPGGMMHQKLNLTEEQKAKFKSQQESFRKQMEELRKNDNITVKEWRSRMETLHKDHKAKMEGLLTSEQKAQIEKKKAEHKAMKDIDAKARMEKMRIRLGLSDEQASKINKNRIEMMEKMKTLREDGKMDMEKKREMMKEMREKHKEQMKSILTEEQMKKLKEGHRQGHGSKHGKRSERKEII